MKIFWSVVIAGVALVAFSSLWSFLGDAASQRSDFGIVAGSVLVIVVVAATAAIGSKLWKRYSMSQGSGDSERKP